MSNNPYAPPAVEEILAEDTVEEAIRRAHINHEASVKSIGLLNYLGVLFSGLAALSALGGSLPSFNNSAERVGFILGTLLLPLILLIAGYSIRRLRRTGQILNLIIYGLTLLLFPIGTLIGLIALYLLLSKKGRMIFSSPYHEIVQATPHIKYRRAKTSKSSWIALLIFLLFITLGVVALLIT